MVRSIKESCFLKNSISSLFGKEEMATFERYFIKDEKTHKEVKNSYYKFRDDEDMCRMIFEEFGLNPKESMIINGHVPVKNIKGESPIKANGKLLVIDGGFAKSYRVDTGIAGYTLIYNSYGLIPIEEDLLTKCFGKIRFIKEFRNLFVLKNYTFRLFKINVVSL